MFPWSGTELPLNLVWSPSLDGAIQQRFQVMVQGVSKVLMY